MAQEQNDTEGFADESWSSQTVAVEGVWCCEAMEDVGFRKCEDGVINMNQVMTLLDAPRRCVLPFAP